MYVQIFTTGGTFDKVYSDGPAEFVIGKAMAPEILREAHVNFDFAVEGLIYKDSQEMTDEDRAMIHNKVQSCHSRHVIITHGASTMGLTAEALLDIPGKTIVLTGAMQPARMRNSDAHFNLGLAVGVVSLLPPGVYQAMNGLVSAVTDARRQTEPARILQSC